MVIRLWLFLICSLLVPASDAATPFTASVDRKHITEQDTFNLVLRYHQQVISGQPELSGLQKDFNIESSRRSTQFHMSNGNSESFTEWQLRLSPKRSGELIIPAISFKGSRTTPISIEVKPPSADVLQQSNKDFFFNVEISKGPYWVQGQILYIEKLYYNQNHDQASLSDLKVTDARVEPLGKVKTYTTVVDGQRFGVYERRYVIYPEQSGELVIPGQRFSAKVPNPYNRWEPAKDVSVVSRLMRLNVQPQPSQYPQAPWLPAKAININEQMSQQQWQVGTPVTRTLTVTANGLSGSQIPALAIAEVDGLRYYPEQNQHQDEVTDSGIKSTMSQAMAIVPTQSGPLTLPEIRVPWWNIRSQKIEYAVIPARTINVAPAPATESSTMPSANDSANTEPGNTQVSPSESSAPHYLLILILVVSTALNIVLLILVLKRRKSTQVERMLSTDKAINSDSLKHACRSDDPARIRSALLHWAQQHPSLSDSQSLSELGQKMADAKIQAALAELDQTLYGQGKNSAFNGSNLWHLVSRWKAPKDQQDNSTLAALYP